MARVAPATMGLASKEVVCRDLTVEIREGRGVGPYVDHILLHRDLWRHSPSACLATRRLRRFLLVWMSLTSLPPLLPAVFHNIGGLPTRCKTQDGHKAENTIVPGSFAAR